MFGDYEETKMGRKPTKIISAIADRAGREYITPEDIQEAAKAGSDINLIRTEVLAHLGKQTAYGCEDGGLCAFVAWNLRRRPKKAA